jgi:hypothetical protein
MTHLLFTLDWQVESKHLSILTSLESQFYRLLGPGAGYTVTKVEYVVNPPLVEKFKAHRLKLAEHMEWEDTKPVLGTNYIFIT